LKKILIIQNKVEDLKEIGGLLPENEFETFYSHNLKDGLEISLRYLPDLILFYLSEIDDGIEMLAKITSQEKVSLIPLVVITENYSVEQFRKVMDLGSDDYIPHNLLAKYLLKSVNKRLDKLSNLKISINSLINSFEEGYGKANKDDHILVKIGNKLKLVKYADIVCITALKEYSTITTIENCKIVVRKSLRNWISLLPSKAFLQIHRSTIINIDFIDKIAKTNVRTYTVHLKYISETFDFSQRYANIMRHSFPT
jgi:DNA-binding LytR/AlgR family response regulator